MQPSALRDFFTPSDDTPVHENAPEFRAAIERLLRRGLLIVALVEIGMTVVTLLIRQFHPQPSLDTLPGWANPIFIVFGVVAALAARWAPRWALQGIAYSIGVATAASLSWIGVAWRSDSTGAYAIVDILLVLLVPVAVIPATFWRMLGYGLVTTGLHLTIVAWAVRRGMTTAPVALEAPLLTLVLLCAFLSGVNYQLVLSEYRAQSQAVEARIRQVQADNAASMGRIAAALSHEFNNPLGALMSSVSSLVSASQKSAASADPRVLTVQRDLAGVALQSASRIEELVRRMQRFTNLDRAEVQTIDVRRVIEDVAGLCLHKNRVQIQLPDLPSVVVQPQAISGALATLLQKAVESDGDVVITGRADDGRVLVHIRCTGEFSLEPGFAVQGGRMAAANWDLFNIRQLIRTQGGDLVPDESGVTLALPAEGSALAAKVT